MSAADFAGMGYEVALFSRTPEKLEGVAEKARFIFVYLLGLVLHSLLTPGKINYEEEIDRFSDEIEPFIKERPYA